jgi:hypothetical protein
MTVSSTSTVTSADCRSSWSRGWRTLRAALTAYLIDALGGDRREDPEVVLRTLTTLWTRTLGVQD